MAPTLTPGRKKREDKFFNVGVEGRKTGVTLKDTGMRDEFGLEPIDGIFSSPRQSTKRTARKSNATLTSSEEMEVGSSAPDPADVLTERRTTRNAASVPRPPISRSPIKTSLGATPRRPPSMGPISSARRSRTPTSIPSHPVKRTLDFTADKIGRAARVSMESDGGQLEDNYDPTQMDDLPDMQANGALDDSPLPGMDEDSVQLQQENDAALSFVETQGSPQPKKRGPRLSNSSNISQEDSGRRKRRSDADETMELDASGNARPAKRSRASEEADAQRAEAGSQKAKKGKKAGRPPSNRAPGAKVVSSKSSQSKSQFKKPALPSGSQSGVQPRQRPLYRVRSETPLEEGAAQHTRSGRLSYRPLNYWKGERAIYRPHDRLETIEEIIRMEEVTPIKNPYTKSQKTRKRRNMEVYEDEEEVEEPWEQDEGIIRGVVRGWDPTLGMGVDDDPQEEELALAASRIEARDGAEANFRFAKTLTLPFFGSGVVELPAGGFKRAKNTRKMQMVFFVHLGKVTVELATTRFVISKGGIFQVPRGNFYSIQNETDRPAKIFFAQGCELVLEPVAALTSPRALEQGY